MSPAIATTVDICGTAGNQTWLLLHGYPALITSASTSWLRQNRPSFALGKLRYIASRRPISKHLLLDIDAPILSNLSLITSCWKPSSPASFCEQHSTWQQRHSARSTVQHSVVRVRAITRHAEMLLQQLYPVVTSESAITYCPPPLAQRGFHLHT